MSKKYDRDHDNGCLPRRWVVGAGRPRPVRTHDRPQNRKRTRRPVSRTPPGGPGHRCRRRVLRPTRFARLARHPPPDLRRQPSPRRGSNPRRQISHTRVAGSRRCPAVYRQPLRHRYGRDRADVRHARLGAEHCRGPRRATRSRLRRVLRHRRLHVCTFIPAGLWLLAVFARVGPGRGNVRRPARLPRVAPSR